MDWNDDDDDGWNDHSGLDDDLSGLTIVGGDSLEEDYSDPTSDWLAEAEEKLAQSKIGYEASLVEAGESTTPLFDEIVSDSGNKATSERAAAYGGMSEAAKQAFKHSHLSDNSAHVFKDIFDKSGSQLERDYPSSGIKAKDWDAARQNLLSVVEMSAQDFSKQLSSSNIEGLPRNNKDIRIAYAAARDAASYSERASATEALRTGPDAAIQVDKVTDPKSFDAKVEAVNAARESIRNELAPRYIMQEIVDLGVESGEYQSALNRATHKLEGWFRDGKHLTRINMLNLDGTPKAQEYAHGSSKVADPSRTLGLPTPAEIPFEGMTYNESVSGNMGTAFTPAQFNEFLQSPEAAGMSDDEKFRLMPSVRKSIVRTPSAGKKPHKSEGIGALKAWEARVKSISANENARKQEYQELKDLSYTIGKAYTDITGVDDSGYGGKGSAKYSLQNSFAAESAYRRDEEAWLGISTDSDIITAQQDRSVESLGSVLPSAMHEKKGGGRTYGYSLTDIVSIHRRKTLSAQDMIDSGSYKEANVGGAGQRSGMYERFDTESSLVRQLVDEGMSTEAALHKVRGTGSPFDDSQRLAMEDITDRDVYLAYVEEGKKAGRLHSDRTRGWYEARKGKLTASLSENLLADPSGKGKPQEQLELEAAAELAERNAGISKFIGTKYTHLGSVGEEWVQRDFKKRTGLNVEEAFFGTVGGNDSIGASPDGMVFDDDGNFQGILEMKHLNSEARMLGSSKKYANQLQLQMAKEGADRAFFYRKDTKGGKPILDIIEADPNKQSKLISAANRVVSMANLAKGVDGAARLRGDANMYKGVQTTEEYRQAIEARKKLEAQKSVFQAEEEVEEVSAPFAYDSRSKKRKVKDSIRESFTEAASNIDLSSKKFTGSVDLERSVIQNRESINPEDMQVITPEVASSVAKKLTAIDREDEAFKKAAQIQFDKEAAKDRAIGAQATKDFDDLVAGNRKDFENMGKAEEAAYKEDAKRSEKIKEDAAKKSADNMRTFTESVKKATKSLGALSKAALKSVGGAQSEFAAADRAAMSLQEYVDTEATLANAGAVDGEGVLASLGAFAGELETPQGWSNFIQSDAATMAGFSAMNEGQELIPMNWEKYRASGRTQQLDMHISQMAQLDAESKRKYAGMHNLEGLFGYSPAIYAKDKINVALPNIQTMRDQNSALQTAERAIAKEGRALVTTVGKGGIEAAVYADKVINGDLVEQAASIKLVAEKTVGNVFETPKTVPLSEAARQKMDSRIERWPAQATQEQRRELYNQKVARHELSKQGALADIDSIIPDSSIRENGVFFAQPTKVELLIKGSVDNVSDLEVEATSEGQGINTSIDQDM